MNKFQRRGILYLQSSRPGFWLTAVWFYLLLVSQQFVFDRFSFWLGLIYVTFPLGFIRVKNTRE